jgi:hypothetical protein
MEVEASFTTEATPEAGDTLKLTARMNRTC